MKKTLLLSLFFCGLSLIINAQLTLTGTGGTYWDTNNTGYNNIYTPTNAAIIALPSPNVIDAGTNIYSYSIYSPLRDHKFIVRMNNFWYIGEHAPVGGINTQVYFQLSFKYKFYSTSINPPCEGPWEKLTAPNIGTFLNLTVSGTTCFQYSSIPNSGSYPNYFQFPALTPAQIAAIPNPQPGMAVWDLVNQCLKIYTGAIWKCIP